MLPKRKLFAFSVLALLFLSMFAGLGVWQIKPVEATTGTFGNTAIGSGNNNSAGNYSVACRFQATESGNVTAITAYLADNYGVDCEGIGSVYSDSSGTPNTLLGQADTIVKILSSSPAWYNFNYSTVVQTTQNSYYWLTLLFNSTFRYWYDSGSSNQHKRCVDNYTDGFASSWGTTTLSLATSNSIYATYNVTSTPPPIGDETGSFGTTGIGSLDNSAYATFVYYEGPYSTPSNTITITQIVLYTTIFGNARVAVYTDLSDIPSELIVESGTQFCSADAWNIFDTTDTTVWEITGSKYWLAVQYGSHYMARRNSTLDIKYASSQAYGAFPMKVSGTPGGFYDGRVSLYANYSQSGVPFYGNIAVNATKAGLDTKFEIRCRDNGTLHYSIFSLDNGVGSYTNATPQALSGSTYWPNETATLTSDIGDTVYYKWYVNDTQGNWITTAVHTLITTAVNDVPIFATESVSTSGTLFAGYTTTTEQSICTPAVNASQPGATANFTLTISADSALLYGILETNNTGVVTNETAVALTGFEDLASRVITLNNTECVVQYRWFGNTTNGYNVTGFYNLTVANPVNGSLYISGNQIKKVSDDSVVVLKGINCGGLGETNAANWATQTNTSINNNLKVMASWGMNHIRIMIMVRLYLQNVSIPSAYLGGGYAWQVRRIVELAANYGIYTTISQWSILSQWDTGYAFTRIPFPPYLNAYEEAVIPDEQAYINYMHDLAFNLKNEPTVLIELWNEPAGTSAAKADWFRVSKLATESIRQVTLTPVIQHWGYCWDVAWAWDAAYGMPWSDLDNIMYSGHIYRAHGTFPSNQYLYADVKTQLETLGYLDAVTTHNLAIYVGETAPNISNGTYTNEEACYNNTLNIVYKEWNISVTAFSWTDTAPWKHLVSTTNFYPDGVGRIFIGGTNNNPFLISAGSSANDAYLNDTSAIQSWNSTAQTLNVTGTGSGTAYVWFFWNVSNTVYPVNNTLNVRFTNGTIVQAQDYYNSTVGMFKVMVTLSTETVIIGYSLTSTSVTVTIISPTNTTYATSTVSVQLSASGGTIDTILWNCTFTNGTVVYANTVYTVATSMTLGNGSYIFNAFANNTDGELDEATVTFTVAISASSVTLVIASPSNTTYTSSTITISMSASGGTIDTIWWNIQFANASWLYAENQTYTVPTSATIDENLTATFYGYANNTDGNSDDSSVTFTVYIVPNTIGYQLSQGVIAAAGFMGIVMLLGMVYVAVEGKDVKFAVMLAVGEILLLVTMLILSQLSILG